MDKNNKAVESIEPGIQIKIIAMVVLFCAQITLTQMPRTRIQYRWLKASGIIKIVDVSILQIFSMSKLSA